MGKKFFTELSRRLYIDGIESSAIEDNRLEIFLHGQPTLYVSPGNDVFLLPAGSKNKEASELYHQVAVAADEVYSYVPDFLTGKKEKNRGQLEMYLVENAHEPIIDRETFDKAQEIKGHIKKSTQIRQMLL